LSDIQADAHGYDVCTLRINIRWCAQRKLKSSKNKTNILQPTLVESVDCPGWKSFNGIVPLYAGNVISNYGGGVTCKMTLQRVRQRYMSMQFRSNQGTG
jgi:hypothetical protein